MPAKITETIKNKALPLFVEGKSVSDVAKILKINYRTADKIHVEFAADIQNTKKEIRAEVLKDTAERQKALALECLSRAETAIGLLTREKIQEGSATAIATTLAILVDKMQLLTGGVTENIQLTISTKQEAINRIMGTKSSNNVIAPAALQPRETSPK